MPGALRTIAFRSIAYCTFASLLLINLSGCATYQVGNQTLHRPDIRSVHVPIFKSESHRRFLGQQLTEAVVKQIERDTPIAIADPAFADSFLRGTIVRERKRSQVLDRFGEPRVLQSDWAVEVEWVDRNGSPLMRWENLTISDAVEFIPEGGQSLASAQRELIQKIARQIVGQMELPW